MKDPSACKREIEICSEQIKLFEMKKRYAGNQASLVQDYDRRIAAATQRQAVAQADLLAALLSGK